MNAHRTSLVLGGGGSTGNAWLIGVVAGLHDAGLDVTSADLTIGTSAGATAAAQFASSTPPELFAAALAPVPPQRTGPIGPTASGAVVDRMARMRAIIDASADVADMRRRIGAAALEMDAASGDSWAARRRSIVSARLPGAEWPESRVILTAVDARTGEPMAFDRSSGVDIVDAVAASTAGGGSTYAIGDARYIDGGYRSNAENADLATGYERVLVLSPLSGRSLHPGEWGTHLATQIEALRASGSRVETVFPTDEHLFGPNAMDVTQRPAAARAGYEQGSALAPALGEFWR